MTEICMWPLLPVPGAMFDCVSISYPWGTCRVRWVPPAGVRPGRKAAGTGSTAAGGEPHLGTGCEGPVPPLHSASGDKQHTVWFSPNELSNMEQRHICQAADSLLYAWFLSPSSFCSRAIFHTSQM